jgi:hypothetical protein
LSELARLPLGRDLDLGINGLDWLMGMVPGILLGDEMIFFPMQS